MSLQVGKRFIISRVSENSDPGGRIPIVLAHGRAFGSGEHETTRSCLEELEAIPISGHSNVLDVGCGTGILAVAAARMGAKMVVALDPCPDAIATTLASVRLNGMEQVVTPVQGTARVIRGAYFDLIMANLYGDIILGSVAEITSLLASEGYLIISGIPWGDAYEVSFSFTVSGCQLLKTYYLEDYSTQVFRKQPPTQQGRGLLSTGS